VRSTTEWVTGTVQSKKRWPIVAAMRVWVEIEGDRKTERGLDRFGRRVTDMSEPMGALGDEMLASIDRQFATEGGGRWKPLDDAYSRWKQKHHPAPMLVLTGSLRRYLAGRRSVTVGPRGVSWRGLPPGELYKLEDRPVWPQVGRVEAHTALERWLRETAREAFPGHDAGL
jgi:hypothetical protein